jgi:hypothetical protein
MEIVNNTSTKSMESVCNFNLQLCLLLAQDATGTLPFK